MLNRKTSTIFHAAARGREESDSEREREREPRKSGVSRCEKSVSEFMIEITRAESNNVPYSPEKLRSRRIRFNKSKIRARVSHDA